MMRGKNDAPASLHSRECVAGLYLPTILRESAPMRLQLRGAHKARSHDVDIGSHLDFQPHTHLASRQIAKSSCEICTRSGRHKHQGVGASGTFEPLAPTISALVSYHN